jgi:hypothetical protein
VDWVRKLLHCCGKATADEWLDVMRHAHRAGLRTTATMMYGTVETDENASTPVPAARPAGRNRGCGVHHVELSAGPTEPGAPRRPVSTPADGYRAHRARQLR